MNAFFAWLDLLDPDDAAVFYGSIAAVVALAVLVLSWLRGAPRCTLCRVRCERMLKSRFGPVCSKCHDAVFRMYHYRVPKLTDEQARRILNNLWRESDGDGWKNG